MLHRSWIGRIALALVFALGIAALAHTIDPPAPIPAPQPAAAASGGDTDFAYAVTRGEREDAVEQVVMCLLIPECSKNSQCDALCGAGLGRCVRNPCPGRICTCR